MHFKKKYILIGLFILTVFLSVPRMVQFYLQLYFPDDLLRERIVQLVKKNVNKAVKFDTVSMDMWGNIVIENLHISSGNDFNDNISLISSPETVIDLRFWDIVQKKVVIAGITFDNARISLLKRYGVSYKESLQEIISTNRPYNRFLGIDTADCLLTINNGTVQYEELFDNVTLQLNIKDFSFSTHFINNNINIQASGDLSNYHTKRIKKSNFSIKGSIVTPDYITCEKSFFDIQLENFDLSYFNPYINKKADVPLLLQGGLSADFALSSFKKNFNVSGFCEAISFGVAKNVKDKERFMILSNENMQLSFNCDIMDNFQHINMRNLVLSDDIINIKSKFKYSNTVLQHALEADIKSNTVDLEVLSRYFTPFNGVSYGGTFRLSCLLDYDFKHNKAHDINTVISFKDFFAEKIVNGHKHDIVHDLKADLSCTENSFMVNINGKKDSSDFTITDTAHITSWDPIQSDHNLKMTSGYMQLSHIWGLGNTTLNEIMKKSYKDKKKGYEEIYFRSKPLGKIVNNNNMNIEVNIKRLGLNSNTFLQDGNMRLTLKNGQLNTEEFALQGYDARYDFSCIGNLRRDMPTLEIKGQVSNFDLGRWARYAGEKSILAGAFSYGFEYTMTGFRMKHLVDNAKARIWFMANNVQLYNNRLQQRLDRYFSSLGYPTDIKSLAIRRAYAEFSEFGENYYVRELSLSSDTLDFSASGRYDYRKGYKVPLYIGIPVRHQEDNTIVTRKKLLLSVTGPLLKPKLGYSTRDLTKELVLF